MKPQTVTKKKRKTTKTKNSSYNDVKREVEKPYAERKEMSIGRGNKMRTPRKHHLTDQEKFKLYQYAKQVGLTCINPFKGRSGLYYGQVEALVQLGSDEWHSFKTVREKIEEILSVEKTKDGRSSWDNARNRKPKDNANAPQDINGRIKTNFKTLQRLPHNNDKNPYGIKLRQFGLCIDIEYRKINSLSAPVPHYRLNTNGLSLDDSLKAEDLIEDGVVTIKPLNNNPFSSRKPRSPRKNAKSVNDSVKIDNPGEDNDSINEEECVIEEVKSLDLMDLEGETVPNDAKFDDFSR